MDALGTRKRWEEDSINEIIENMEGLVGLTKFSESRVNKKDKHIMKVNSFSDTILISFTQKNIPSLSQDKIGMDMDNLELASLVAGNLLVLGLSLDLPFRGCISFGDFYTGDEMLLGDPINEAASYFEQPNWIGLSLTPSAHKIIPDINYPPSSNFVGMIFL